MKKTYPNQLKYTKKLYNISIVLLFISFICGLAFPQNALWAIPIGATFIATGSGKQKIEQLREKVKKMYGSDEEEYF